MDIIGKSTINPVLFYSGKISGYLTWTVLILLLGKINIMNRLSICFNDFISIPFLIIGFIFSILSLMNLGSATRLGLPSEDTVLKIKGLYKISRNPMYLGFNLLTIAAMIYTLNITIIILGVYSILIYHLIIMGEERFLEKRFGSAYINYKKKVRRYL
jgi:protein-S-isoprenylcysteine O-methyltransferase Ste14